MVITRTILRILLARSIKTIDAEKKSANAKRWTAADSVEKGSAEMVRGILSMPELEYQPNGITCIAPYRAVRMIGYCSGDVLIRTSPRVCQSIVTNTTIAKTRT